MTCYVDAVLSLDTMLHCLLFRLVQEAGSFVVALPNAYHAAINTGFNVAEAVAVGPWDWLPAGAEAVRKYRQQGRPVAFSYDQLLVTLVRVAVVPMAGGRCLIWLVMSAAA